MSKFLDSSITRNMQDKQNNYINHFADLCPICKIGSMEILPISQIRGDIEG